jgi:hypothetical protein
MTTIEALAQFFRCHTTKLLGFAQVTLGSLALSDGIFQPQTVKIILLCSGLATAWRGFASTAANAPPPPPPQGP